MEKRSESWIESRFRYTRVRDVKCPIRANDGDAGIDFYIPTDLSLEELKSKNPSVNLITHTEASNGYVSLIILKPRERVLIPSGIRVLLEPKNSMLQANNKSGISTKKGLIFTAQVVDSPYTGEVHIGVTNISNQPVSLKAGDKLIQFIHIPIFQTELEEIPQELYEEIAKDWGTRGDKGFGSSDEELKQDILTGTSRVNEYEDELNQRSF